MKRERENANTLSSLQSATHSPYPNMLLRTRTREAFGGCCSAVWLNWRNARSKRVLHYYYYSTAAILENGGNQQQRPNAVMIEEKRDLSDLKRMGSVNFVPGEVIKRKREGRTLTDAEIKWMTTAFHEGTIRDYQMSAFLMAIAVKGMNDKECAVLTSSMVSTGETVLLSQVLRNKASSLGRESHHHGSSEGGGGNNRFNVVDKHSTGGVGDKTSLVVVPLAASLGLTTPMYSSKGLGHTGGTIDKLESIPNVNVNISTDDFETQLLDIGCGIVSPNKHVSPVENRMYALRDTSGSVESPALIASSIMSKKLARKPDALLLDVKTGRGALMPHLKDAVALARMMVSIGEREGVNTRALITNMEQPLGANVGNFVEVMEAVQVLNPVHYASLPSNSTISVGEVRELALVEVAAMLCISNAVKSFKEAYNMAEEKLNNGEAFRKFLKMVQMQQGDVTCLLGKHETEAYLEKNTYGSITITSNRDGKVKSIDAYKIGMASISLGCGRSRVDDRIDPFAGITLHAKVGDFIRKGDALFTCRVGFNASGSSAFVKERAKGTARENSSMPALFTAPQIRLERGVKRAREAFHLCDPHEHASPDLLVSYVVDDHDIYSFDQALDVSCFTRRGRKTTS